MSVIMRLGAPPWAFRSRSADASRLCIAAALDDFIEDIPVLIDGAPQPVLFAGDSADHLIKMPDVIWGWSFATKPAGKIWPEFLSPSADRSYDPALEQHLFDQA